MQQPPPVIVRETYKPALIPQVAAIVVLFVCISVWFPKLPGILASLIAAAIYLVFCRSMRRVFVHDQKRGIAAYRARRFQDALVRFRASREFFLVHRGLDSFRSLLFGVASKNPYRVIAVGNMAYCHLQLGANAEALKLFEQVLLEAPDHKQAKKAVKILKAALPQKLDVPIPVPETLRTDRLVLRPTLADDIGILADMITDPEVMAHYGDGRTPPRERAETAIRTYDLHCHEYNYWAWTATLTSTGEILGAITAGWDNLDDKRAVALSFILRRAFWRQGFGTEAVAVVMRHGQQHLHWPCVWAGVTPTNIASIRLCEKLGLKFLREERTPAGVLRRVYVSDVGTFSPSS